MLARVLAQVHLAIVVPELVVLDSTVEHQAMEGAHLETVRLLEILEYQLIMALLAQALQDIILLMLQLQQEQKLFWDRDVKD